MWKTDPIDECIHKYKHDHIYIFYMFPIMGLFEEARGRRERKRE
jgi:hypothetical protein